MRPKLLLLDAVCSIVSLAKILSACELGLQLLDSSIEPCLAIFDATLVSPAHAVDVDRVTYACLARTPSSNPRSVRERHESSTLSSKPAWDGEAIVGLGSSEELQGPFDTRGIPGKALFDRDGSQKLLCLGVKGIVPVAMAVSCRTESQLPERVSSMLAPADGPSSDKRPAHALARSPTYVSTVTDEDVDIVD